MTYTISWPINSLAPRKFEWNFRYVICKRILVIDGWDISCKITLIWMSQDFTDDQSKLVQVMAWCRQATSHYMSQCWYRTPWPHGVTRPQWVNCVLNVSDFTPLFSHGQRNRYPFVEGYHRKKSSKWDLIVLAKTYHLGWFGWRLSSEYWLYALHSWLLQIYENNQASYS